MPSKTTEINHFDITTQLCKFVKKVRPIDSAFEIVVAIHLDIVDVRLICQKEQEDNYLNLIKEHLNNAGYLDKYTIGSGSFGGESMTDKLMYIAVILKYVIVKWSIENQLPVIIDAYYKIQELKSVMKGEQSKSL